MNSWRAFLLMPVAALAVVAPSEPPREGDTPHHVSGLIQEHEAKLYQ